MFKEIKPSGQLTTRTDNKSTMEREKSNFRLTANSLSFYTKTMELSRTIGDQTSDYLHVLGNNKGAENMSPCQDGSWQLHIP